MGPANLNWEGGSTSLNLGGPTSPDFGGSCKPGFGSCRKFYFFGDPVDLDLRVLELLDFGRFCKPEFKKLL